jgi:hypothetical protein
MLTDAESRIGFSTACNDVPVVFRRDNDSKGSSKFSSTTLKQVNLHVQMRSFGAYIEFGLLFRGRAIVVVVEEYRRRPTSRSRLNRFIEHGIIK